MISAGTGGLWCKWTSEHHLNYSIIKIGQNINVGEQQKTENLQNSGPQSKIDRI